MNRTRRLLVGVVGLLVVAAIILLVINFSYLVPAIGAVQKEPKQVYPDAPNVTSTSFPADPDGPEELVMGSVGIGENLETQIENWRTQNTEYRILPDGTIFRFARVHSWNMGTEGFFAKVDPDGQPPSEIFEPTVVEAKSYDVFIDKRKVTVVNSDGETVEGLNKKVSADIFADMLNDSDAKSAIQDSPHLGYGVGLYVSDAIERDDGSKYVEVYTTVYFAHEYSKDKYKND